MTASDIENIRKLNLLDKDEKIIKFYSNFENDVAGNFFTDKRLAKYWIDKKDSSKNVVAFAFYRDIQSIDTVYDAGMTYCSYMRVQKIDGTEFRVCADGKRHEIQSFFEEAMERWARIKNVK